MRAEAGFTLIEALVGGIISTVLAGAMLSLFYLVTGNVKESAANSRLLRIQTVAQDQLRRNVRKSYGAKRTETEVGGIASIAASDNVAYVGQKEVWLYETDPDGLVGAYKISGDTLLERANAVFSPMLVGSDTVWLDGANSSFSLFPNRRGIAFDLRYRIHENGKTYSAPPLIDSILCRAQL
jgi:type II secretory pathway pseudopilin PulG